MPSTTSFSEFLSSIASRGRNILGITALSAGRTGSKGIIKLCHELLSSKGEASGIALSFEILNWYGNLGGDQKTQFFLALHNEFSADKNKAMLAAKAYVEDQSPENLSNLTAASEPLRGKLIIRLNQAPNATHSLLNMRSDLLKRLAEHPELEMVDRDFAKLFASWFNGGFLELRSLGWSSSASLLEKIIQYEAVHGIADWNDLRRRLDPPDRRIYGFFHPRLGEEPLIFVEVALSTQMPSTIASILDEKRPIIEPTNATTATFYSISNCQDGLRRIPLGNFLIKQVVEDLKKSFPTLKEFVTLSPVPGFAKWVDEQINAQTALFASPAMSLLSGLHACRKKKDIDEFEQPKLATALVAHYLCNVRSQSLPRDPVARFHLGNGARLERINWAGDVSPAGLANAHGLMVNYSYRLDDIEENHEKFAHGGEVIASPAVKRLANSLTSVQQADASNTLEETRTKI
jgi:malonyl-CoA decarboxylase